MDSLLSLGRHARRTCSDSEEGEARPDDTSTSTRDARTVASMKTVRASLTFPATGVEHRLPVVRVLVEDVSKADAAASVVGSADLHDVVVPAEGTTVDVDVDYPGEPAGARLTVRAHGSANGDSDRFAAGDFLSMQSIPPADEVVIPLRAI